MLASAYVGLARKDAILCLPTTRQEDPVPGLAFVNPATRAERVV